jgi:hypothetical protein
MNKVRVFSTEWDFHYKRGKSDKVRITYTCQGIPPVSEWIDPASADKWPSFFYRKFCRSIGLNEPFPKSAREFLDNTDLPSAAWISVEEEDGWTRVKEHVWRPKEKPEPEWQEEKEEEVPGSITLAAIKKIYRTMAMKHHPDHGGNDDFMKGINDFYKEIEKTIDKRYF